MRSWLFSGILLLGFSSFRPNSVLVRSKADAPGSLYVRIDNVRNTKGRVSLLLFRSSTGFPDNPPSAVASRSLPVNEDGIYKFDRLPPGKYALSVIHDENENARLDKNVLGIPREGYGFSGNPKALFGPPGFDMVAFSFDGSSFELSVKLIYW